jgi:hypothetical protein
MLREYRPGSKDNGSFLASSDGAADDSGNKEDGKVMGGSSNLEASQSQEVSGSAELARASNPF